MSLPHRRQHANLHLYVAHADQQRLTVRGLGHRVEHPGHKRAAAVGLDDLDLLQDSQRLPTWGYRST